MAESVEGAGVVTITAKSPSSQREVIIERNLGANLAEAVALFGEEVIYAAALSQIEIRIQGAIRTTLDSGYKVKKDKDGNDVVVGEVLSEEDARRAGLEYTPGVQKRSSASKANPFAALAAKIASGEMTEAEVMAAVLAQLTAR